MPVAKDELRKELRRTRDGLAPEQAERAAAAAARHLMTLRDLPETRSQLTLDRVALVALYASIRGEIDTGPIAARLIERDIPLAYPRVQQGSLRLAFHRVSAPEDLAPGAYGIPEPDRAAPIVPLAALELIVVPAMAFDPRGYRLGWGKGYYDVTLAEATRALRVGLAFECQVVPEVPTDWNDVPVDIIVTEDGIRRCSAHG